MGIRDSALDWLGPLSGVAFVGLFLAGVGLSGSQESPSPDEPSTILARYLLDERGNTDLGLTLRLLGLFCFFWFVSYLRARMRAHEGANGWLSSVAYGGGLVAATLMLVWGSIELAMRSPENFGADTQVAKTLYILSWDFVIVVLPPLAAFVGATSLFSLRAVFVPRWLGWLGMVIALALLTPAGWLGFLAVFPWTVVLALALLWRNRVSAPAPALA